MAERLTAEQEAAIRRCFEVVVPGVLPGSYVQLLLAELDAVRGEKAALFKVAGGAWHTLAAGEHATQELRDAVAAKLGAVIAECGGVDPGKRLGEWRCKCPRNPAADPSLNHPGVAGCSLCGAERP